MKKIATALLAAACMVTLGRTADAADIARPVYKAAAAPVASWTGFYAGLHGGWGWASGDPGVASASRTGFNFDALNLDLNGNGPLFGGQIGYNWQINPNWVIGIEGDITGTGLKGSATGTPSCPTPSCASGPLPVPGASQFMERDVNWLASLRGRLGYAWGPSMVYVTGGAAWANIDYKGNTADAAFVCAGNGCAYPASFNSTKAGWALGAGYEAMITTNWTVRAEYLYYSFGGTAASAAGSPAADCAAASCTAAYAFPAFDIHTMRVGVNYKFADAAHSAYAAAPAPVASWTGFYAGLHTGWGWSSDDLGAASATVVGVAAGFETPLDLNSNGPLFGGQIGYNWQINPNWVIGIEGDITGTALKSSAVGTPLCSTVFCVTPAPVPVPGASQFMERDVNWLASLRGRLGYAWGPSMVYVTGGVAWANIDYKANTADAVFVCNGGGGGGNGCAYPAAFSKTKTGWTLGAGYETMLTANWTLRAEYLFYKFDGTATTTVAGTPLDACAVASCTATYTFPEFNIQTVRVAVNYKF